MTVRSCYVCEEPIPLGDRAVTEYVAGVDPATSGPDEIVVDEVLRHPTCEPTSEPSA